MFNLGLCNTRKHAYAYAHTLAQLRLIVMVFWNRQTQKSISEKFELELHSEACIPSIYPSIHTASIDREYKIRFAKYAHITINTRMGNTSG